MNSQCPTISKAAFHSPIVITGSLTVQLLSDETGLISLPVLEILQNTSIHQPSKIIGFSVGTVLVSGLRIPVIDLRTAQHGILPFGGNTVILVDLIGGKSQNPRMGVIVDSLPDCLNLSTSNFQSYSRTEPGRN